ncbi:MAG: hypothetical protein ACE5ID_02025 [Acidobacteriota bacterium]
MVDKQPGRIETSLLERPRGRLLWEGLSARVGQDPLCAGSRNPADRHDSSYASGYCHQEKGLKHPR